MRLDKNLGIIVVGIRPRKITQPQFSVGEAFKSQISKMDRWNPAGGFPIL